MRRRYSDQSPHILCMESSRPLGVMQSVLVQVEPDGCLAGVVHVLVVAVLDNRDRAATAPIGRGPDHRWLLGALAEDRLLGRTRVLPLVLAGVTEHDDRRVGLACELDQGLERS